MAGVVSALSQVVPSVSQVVLVAVPLPVARGFGAGVGQCQRHRVGVGAGAGAPPPRDVTPSHRDVTLSRGLSPTLPRVPLAAGVTVAARPGWPCVPRAHVGGSQGCCDAAAQRREYPRCHPGGTVVRGGGKRGGSPTSECLYYRVVSCVGVSPQWSGVTWLIASAALLVATLGDTCKVTGVSWGSVSVWLGVSPGVPAPQGQWQDGCQCSGLWPLGVLDPGGHWMGARACAGAHVGYPGRCWVPRKVRGTCQGECWVPMRALGVHGCQVPASAGVGC